MTSKLAVATPSSQLVNAYLVEIARGYGIEWDAPELDGASEIELTDTQSVVSAMHDRL